MLTIGFANHYYTLWSVITSERFDASSGATYQRTTYKYRQNLSMDFDAAKEKIEAITQEYDIDLDLRGEQGRFYFTERMIKDMDLWRFTFGKLAGKSMLDCNDDWQLYRAYQEEPNRRRRIYARNRMLEIGALVKYTWQETTTMWRPGTQDELLKIADSMGIGLEKYLKYNLSGEVPYTSVITHKYCKKKHAEFLKQKEEQDKLQGHFFTAGERVSVLVKLVKSFHYNTEYGTTFIQILLTDDNKIIKYKGSSPATFEGDDFITIKGTVEHGEYKGVKETRLKRIKIQKNCSVS